MSVARVTIWFWNLPATNLIICGLHRLSLINLSFDIRYFGYPQKRLATSLRQLTIPARRHANAMCQNLSDPCLAKNLDSQQLGQIQIAYQGFEPNSNRADHDDDVHEDGRGRDHAYGHDGDSAQATSIFSTGQWLWFRNLSARAAVHHPHGND